MTTIMKRFFKLVMGEYAMPWQEGYCDHKMDHFKNFMMEMIVSILAAPAGAVWQAYALLVNLPQSGLSELSKWSLAAGLAERVAHFNVFETDLENCLRNVIKMEAESSSHSCFNTAVTWFHVPEAKSCDEQDSELEGYVKLNDD